MARMTLRLLPRPNRDLDADVPGQELAASWEHIIGKHVVMIWHKHKIWRGWPESVNKLGIVRLKVESNGKKTLDYVNLSLYGLWNVYELVDTPEPDTEYPLVGKCVRVWLKDKDSVWGRLESVVDGQYKIQVYKRKPMIVGEEDVKHVILWPRGEELMKK